MRFLDTLVLCFAAYSMTSANVMRADTTDMQSMIGNLKMGEMGSLSSIESMMGSIPQAVEIAKEYLKFSPLIKSIIDKAASKNIKIKIMEELVEGKALSFSDLVKLATEKSSPFLSDMKAAFRNNEGFQKIIQLRPHIHEPGAVEKVTEILTGKKIQTGPSPQIPVDDKYHVIQTNNPVYQEWKHLVFFWTDNHAKLYHLMGLMVTAPVDYLQILSEISSLDYSNLPKSLTSQQKGTITNGADIVKDVQTSYPLILKSHDAHAAQLAVSQWFHNFRELFFEILLLVLAFLFNNN